MTIFEACWQKELANSFTEPEKLLQYLDISPEKYTKDIKARSLFPLRVPRPFAAKIAKATPNDPLLLQVMTHAAEFDQVAGYVDDPLGEHDAVLPGVLHKYKSRVLLILRGGCAVNCRYCFRRHFPYQDNGLNKAALQQAIDYIASDDNINEVLLSGGDPLMAKDEQLKTLFEQLAQINHLTRVRIHTRLPVVIPQRITQGLIDIFRQTRLKVIVVQHINHANEIDEMFEQAIKPLRSPNVTLFNQAVLLKGINDSLTAQINLSERLFEVGILPYYLHVLDKVTGAAHFDVTDEEAAALYKNMLAELPGFLMPKWAREEAGKSSKTPLHFA